MFKAKVYYMHGDKGHISKDCPKKNETVRPNVPLKPNLGAHNIIANGINFATEDQE